MPKLILITGGSASGKSTLTNLIRDELRDSVVYVSQDAFYKSTGDPMMNYDEPGAFDFKLQSEVIKNLLDNKETELPIYDFEVHKRKGSVMLKPSPLIILEGLFTFVDKRTNDLASFKIFIDTPADTRLSRRILRDVKTRGRSVESVIDRWSNDVQPSYKRYISNFKWEADVIIPWSNVKRRSISSLIATFQGLLSK